MSFDNPVTQGVKLVLDAIRSPNYVANSTGWTINKDGSAEFNDIDIRGTLTVVGSGSSKLEADVIGSQPALIFTDQQGNEFYVTFNAPGVSDTTFGLTGQGGLHIPWVNFVENQGFFVIGDGHAGQTAPGFHVGLDGFVRRSTSLVTFEDWQAIPALQNGWTSPGVFYQEGRYRLGPDGFVVLDGILNAGTTADSTLLFTMPVGYRPAKSHLILGGSGGPPNTSTLQVNADGTCRCFGTGAAGMSLTNMRYPVAALS